MKRIPRPRHEYDVAGIALYRRIRRRRHLIAWVILTVILFVALGVMYVVTGLNLEPGPALLFLYLMFRNGR